MKSREFVQVDPAALHLPSSRRDGAEPLKLHRQVARHGLLIDGMPPPEVKRGSDGELVIFDGVTARREWPSTCRVPESRSR